MYQPVSSNSANFQSDPDLAHEATTAPEESAPLKHWIDPLKLHKLGFFICGLVNNFVYVLFLSAAIDILHRSASNTLPEGVILLADILPSLIVKLTVPYVIHIWSYR